MRACRSASSPAAGCGRGAPYLPRTIRSRTSTPRWPTSSSTAAIIEDTINSMNARSFRVCQGAQSTHSSLRVNDPAHVMVARDPDFNGPPPFVGARASPLRERPARSADGTGLAQHLADLGDVGLLGGHLRARVFLQHDVAPGHRRQELAVLGESFLLVHERLAQNLIDVVLVRLQQRADLERRVTREIGDVL